MLSSSRLFGKQLPRQLSQFNSSFRTGSQSAQQTAYLYQQPLSKSRLVSFSHISFSTASISTASSSPSPSSIGSGSSDLPKRGALTGIRVLDLSRILAGPYCTQILADNGADIWKIENPLGGDDTRFWGPPFVKPKEMPVIESPRSTANAYAHIGESAYFLSANRNKQSLAINMKDPKGSAIIRELAKHADVLVENFLPGKLAEFGLDYATLKSVNPSLIYASLTGFGSFGPLANRPGYDVMAAARGGLMHITGGVEAPSKVGVAITDLSTGLVLNSAILAALFARERDPLRRGQLIETNLLSVQVASLANIGQNYHCDPTMVGRRFPNSSHESIVPYQAFECAPSESSPNESPNLPSPSPSPSTSTSSTSRSNPTEYFICGALNNKQFSHLMLVLDELAASKPGLDVSFIRDSNYSNNALRVKNRETLIPKLQAIFKHFTKSHLLQLLAQYDIPSSPINNIRQVFEDEQVVASGIVKELDHPVIGRLKVTSNPVSFSQTPTSIRSPPPMLGQHTQEILRNVLQMNTNELRELEEKRIIGVFEPIRDSSE